MMSRQLKKEKRKFYKIVLGLMFVVGLIIIMSVVIAMVIDNSNEEEINYSKNITGMLLFSSQIFTLPPVTVNRIQ